MHTYQNVRISKSAGFIGLIMSVTLFATNDVAAAFDSNISITATAGLSGTSYTDDSAINQTGTFSSILAGLPGSATVDSALGVTGSLPQGGVLTEIGDGVGINFTGNANSSQGIGAAGLFGDYAVGMTNNSVVDTFKVTLGWEFTNQVDANGLDVGIEGELFLIVNGAINEFFFSDLISDTALGDQAGGSDDNPDTNWESPFASLASSGEALLDQGILFFDFILTPGQVINLTGRNDMEVFLFDGDYSATVSSELYVSNVENLTNTPPPPSVPEPTSVWLIAAGLAGFCISRRLV